MKKWIISALVYLALVISAYYIVDSLIDREPVEHTGEHQELNSEVDDGHHEVDEHNDSDGHHDHGDSSEHGENEVFPLVSLEGENIVIELLDKEKNPVDNLRLNHEKLMHLIIVSEDLESFTHLHPEKSGPGIFEVVHSLEEGTYNVYVDIAPDNLHYEIQPVTVTVGSHANHTHGAILSLEENWTKEQAGYEVTLSIPSSSVKNDVLLQFEINGGIPEQYLGALGHVVIIDESMEQFIHVHPTSEETPTFNAHFSTPGLYKLWAEFKLDGVVYAFPYVIEITE